MTSEPSYRTSALAGVWAALGLVPYDLWDRAHNSSHDFPGSLLFLVVIAVFLIIPGIYLVLGHRFAPFRRTWVADPLERARYGMVARRMFIWFISAVVAGVVWSLVLS